MNGDKEAAVHVQPDSGSGVESVKVNIEKRAAAPKYLF